MIYSLDVSNGRRCNTILVSFRHFPRNSTRKKQNQIRIICCRFLIIITIFIRDCCFSLFLLNYDLLLLVHLFLDKLFLLLTILSIIYNIYTHIINSKAGRQSLFIDLKTSQVWKFIRNNKLWDFMVLFMIK